jgi:nicotinate-nucleotide adenylyltransferase
VVDQVWLMPAFHHPFGKAIEAFEHRLAMCAALCRDAAGWLVASDVERSVGGEGWTVETLEHLRRTRAEDRFLLVIGSDILADLPKWKRFDRIRELAEVLVLHRAGHPAPEAVGPALAEVSSTEIRARLSRGELSEGWVPRAVLEYIQTHGLYR